jgi:hypothetical protein
MPLDCKDCGHPHHHGTCDYGNGTNTECLCSSCDCPSCSARARLRGDTLFDDRETAALAFSYPD